MASLAGKVRKTGESDEWDLANFDQAKCNDLCKAAFSEPFALSTMVRLSFVVGGGKLVRQKYSDDLPKVMMGALSAIGYKDDESAAINKESGGKFKYQHDTNKNLKFVHVFPLIGGGAAAEGGEEEEEEEDEGPKSPEEALMVFEGEDFERLVNTHLKTYSQLKRLLDMLKARVVKLEEIEAKMIKMVTLSAEEQKLFDSIAADALKVKMKFVGVKLQGMVDDGKLTSAEKTALMEQLESKLETVEVERAKAEAEGKAKKVTAMEASRDVMLKTKSVLKDCTAVGLPPLRYNDEIRKLHAKMRSLLQIEKEKKGHYTMDELKKIGEKTEIEEALGEYQSRSRMWLEDDGVFQERLDACKRSSAPPKKTGGGGGGGASSGGGKGGGYSAGGFQTVSGSGKTAAKAKSGGPATKNAFSALG